MKSFFKISFFIFAAAPCFGVSFSYQKEKKAIHISFNAHKAFETQRSQQKQTEKLVFLQKKSQKEKAKNQARKAFQKHRKKDREPFFQAFLQPFREKSYSEKKSFLLEKTLREKTKIPFSQQLPFFKKSLKN